MTTRIILTTFLFLITRNVGIASMPYLAATSCNINQPLTETNQPTTDQITSTKSLTQSHQPTTDKITSTKSLTQSHQPTTDKITSTNHWHNYINQSLTQSHQPTTDTITSTNHCHMHASVFAWYYKSWKVKIILYCTATISKLANKYISETY